MKYYLINLKNFTKKEYDECISLMCESRKQYVNSISNPKRKLETVAGEWLLKKAASQLLIKKTESIIIERTEKGKPFVKGADIHISLSHSSDFVAAVADTCPIGIDIELIKENNFKALRKICTESDFAFFESSEDKNIAFYKIWTSKEAYFKKKGTGIKDLKSISYTDINPIHYFEEGLIITIVK